MLLANDGASRAVRDYALHTWPSARRALTAGPPGRVLDAVHEAERHDPDGVGRSGKAEEGILGLDSRRPMRTYLEAVRDDAGASALADLEQELRRRGVFPDGSLEHDLGRLADAGLVREFRVEVPGRRRPDRRWTITPVGLATLERFAAGALQPPSPDPEVTGEWHHIDGFSYSASCHPASLPGWAVRLGEDLTGLEGLVASVILGLTLRRFDGPPWAATILRIRRPYLRPVVLHRVEFDDPDAAAALTAHWDRELRAGRLPDKCPRHAEGPVQA